ncbi:MAG TPA: hypothetical protein VFR90_05850 [Methylibium sp.]|uniref:hypothetical protein n=1 Tax=Methylibium sp. TaxID=2067992 RepID=UPI002DBAB1B7|nr:hypothetical protein [Methylibium sp.]HEU4458627.1 hypothetical protein [Methylibium sp.]
MSLKHLLVGLFVSAVALVGTVTTVSAAGGDLGFGGNRGAQPASTVRLAAAPVNPTVGAGVLRSEAAAPRSFDDAPTPADEEALPASSLGVLALAALMAIGLLMTRRGGRL